MGDSNFLPFKTIFAYFREGYKNEAAPRRLPGVIVDAGMGGRRKGHFAKEKIFPSRLLNG